MCQFLSDRQICLGSRLRFMLQVPMLRHAFCLTNGIVVQPTALLTKGDVAFCENVAGCDVDELSQFEREGKHLRFFQGASTGLE